ncbi:MerR family transcriptional regulator [Nocardia sp. ET3-3]|uniref:MerR family transcriptional regulator n=1 Tax=Nocardia terrae TaxID=2675851 RepID=A0A7K1V405_9NOCA|nr:MerR family transcriptional regulator [Nocardia terrae]MVU81355.1 MerR family transcriptional regulator [Nocardia terrae]
MRERMTIGELSRRTGVTVKALREYTDLGLIYSLGRSPGGYRLYDTGALLCVRFISEMRAMGLTIAEIHELAATFDEPGTDTAVESHLERLLVRSRARLRARIAAARQILDRIDDFEYDLRRRASTDPPHWMARPQNTGSDLP